MSTNTLKSTLKNGKLVFNIYLIYNMICNFEVQSVLLLTDS